MKTANFKHVVLGLAMVLVSQAALADIVFDPKNFAKNVITSAQAVRQTAIELNQYATLVNQYQTMLQNIKQLSPAVVADGIARGILPPDVVNDYGMVMNATNGVYSSTQGLLSNMNGMSSLYDKYNTMMGDMTRESIAANVSYEQLLQYDYERAKQGVIENRNYYRELQQMSGQLHNYQARQDKLTAQIPNSSGVHEMLGIIAVQNNLTQDQMSHMLQLSTLTVTKQMQLQDEQNQNAMKEVAARAGNADRINKQTSDYFGNR